MISKKNILLLHSSNDLYGASKIFLQLINLFIDDGFNVHVVLPEKGKLDDFLNKKDIEVSYHELGVLRKKYINPKGLIDRLVTNIKAIKFLSNYIKVNSIDLVYTNTSTILSGGIAAKTNNVSSLFHIHEIPAGNPIYSRFITVFLNIFPRKIICVSKSVYDFWIINGLNKSKAKIIYNGFNIKKSKSKILSKDKIVFTSIARIIPYKGHLLLIRIFEMLCKKNKNIYLQIVGDTLPEYQRYLNELKLDIRKKELNNNIKFLGFRDDVISILDKSNFFIHTPLSPDPLPTVIFEAIKCEIPIITNKLGGAYEILEEGKNGLIIKNDLVDDSVEKILSYLDNKKQQSKNIQKAFNYVCKNFSQEKFKREVLNTIE